MSQSEEENQSQYGLKQYIFPFSKVKDDSKRYDNSFYSNFFQRKYEISNKIKELMLVDYEKVGDMTEIPRINGGRDEEDEGEELQKGKCKGEEEKSNIFNTNNSKTKRYNPRPLKIYKRHINNVHEEMKKKRLVSFSNNGSSISIINKPQYPSIKNVKLNHNKSNQIYLTDTNRPLCSVNCQDKNFHHFTPLNIHKTPKVNYKSFNNIVEKSIKQSTHNNILINLYLKKFDKEKIYHSRNSSEEKDEDIFTSPVTRSSSFKSNLYSFKNRKTGKNILLTQGISNLLNFGDSYLRMEDVRCYNQRKLIHSLYPIIQKEADVIIANKPFEKRYPSFLNSNKRSPNVNSKKIQELVKKSEHVLFKINHKRDSLININQSFI